MESDSELLAQVKAGQIGAFEVLYSRHKREAIRAAAIHASNYSDAEDHAADAFAAVLQYLVAGEGPDPHFRAYLHAVIRRMAHARNLAQKRVKPTADVYVLDCAAFDGDNALAEFEATAVSRAFASLPERWQLAVLLVDIKGLKPAQASEILGVSPNAVSSLALRAREGLRKAYLQNHVSRTRIQSCGEIANNLGAYVRKGLNRKAEAEVGKHLDDCAECSRVVVEIHEIQTAMPPR
ncbi:hypothetical protein DM794_17410 [Paenarthrobacter ureafaciens]|uniref:RNA polymerase sigma factor n=1 Tax=Paenarthrobacter ureafaciens TaxID=37931 RepID=UPI0015BC18EA|nr:sigma-70 family RNA polymerase sigma factor [Paenarthrobacter ureafaciens]MEC3854074.1 sigma-70 family RNA polymerase sigma factor [Paenarthrobacter ureafaciens]NWL28816.1 hypothetical protein [Paenarthrobacter ureafaciens]